jgi:hypothetical protein
MGDVSACRLAQSLGGRLQTNQIMLQLGQLLFTFFSSRLIAANMLMDPPEAIYMRDRLKPIPCSWDVLFSLQVVCGNRMSD